MHACSRRVCTHKQRQVEVRCPTSRMRAPQSQMKPHSPGKRAPLGPLMREQPRQRRGQSVGVVWLTCLLGCRVLAIFQLCREFNTPLKRTDTSQLGLCSVHIQFVAFLKGLKRTDTSARLCRVTTFMQTRQWTPERTNIEPKRWFGPFFSLSLCVSVSVEMRQWKGQTWNRRQHVTESSLTPQRCVRRRRQANTNAVSSVCILFFAVYCSGFSSVPRETSVHAQGRASAQVCTCTVYASYKVLWIVRIARIRMGLVELVALAALVALVSNTAMVREVSLVSVVPLEMLAALVALVSNTAMVRVAASVRVVV